MQIILALISLVGRAWLRLRPTKRMSVDGLMWVRHKKNNWIAENSVGRKMGISMVPMGNECYGDFVVKNDNFSVYFNTFQEAHAYVSHELMVSTIEVMGDVCCSGK